MTSPVHLNPLPAGAMDKLRQVSTSTVATRAVYRVMTRSGLLACRLE
jgi:hypothetical protein